MEILNFKISKALKALGFNEPCNSYYFYQKLYSTIVTWYNSGDKYTESAEYCTAPTIYQVGKWLREEKKIHISVEVTQIYYYFTISFIPNCNKISSDKKFFTFEEAFKEAINIVINII